MNKVSHRGVLNLAGALIPCYVLENGTRVLSGAKTQEALKVTENKKSGNMIKRFLDQISLRPFTQRFAESNALNPIICYDGTKRFNGYTAEAITDICDIMMEAKDVIDLSPRQMIVATQCRILASGFMRVGLTALIDEATGYQAERNNTELQKILAAYISDEAAKWQLTFSNEFYKEVYRLYNIPEPTGHSKPIRVGKITNDLIYKKLPNGVLEALKEKTGKTESGNWQHKLHQSLTPDVGRQHLKNQIVEVTTLMAVSDSKEQFRQLFNKMYSTKELREAV